MINVNVVDLVIALAVITCYLKGGGMVTDKSDTCAYPVIVALKKLS
jgi:hypothetical protein